MFLIYTCIAFKVTTFINERLFTLLTNSNTCPAVKCASPYIHVYMVHQYLAHVEFKLWQMLKFEANVS